MMKPVSSSPDVDAAYRGLYRAGGIAALLAALLTLGEVLGLAFYPPPATVEGWFMLFQRSKLIGLLDFWGMETPMYLLFILVFLALYALLRRANESRMAIALACALLGVAVFLATNNPFTMLALSNQYAAATTDAQRTLLLAAGQAVLINTSQRAVGGFNMGLFLVSIAGLLVSSVMLQSRVFSRFTAYVGLLAFALSLADYLREALTASAIVALLVVLPNALCLIIWFTAAGRRLYQSGAGHTVRQSTKIYN